jgi:DNA polymerase-3 subunit delta'
MLFPSTLVICQDQAVLNKYLDAITRELGHYPITNDPDIFLVSEYTVENIRTIKNFLSRSPYSHTSKLVIIPQAELLNLESQNTLLKDLEEPGKDNYFIVATSIAASLLPTIISRCHQIHLNEGNTKIISKPITFPTNITSALETSDTFPKNKDELLLYLNDQLQIFQQMLVKDPSDQNIKTITKLIKTVQMVKANVEPRAAVDFLMLS